jgi:hypothetical protein
MVAQRRPLADAAPEDEVIDPRRAAYLFLYSVGLFSVLFVSYALWWTFR